MSARSNNAKGAVSPTVIRHARTKAGFLPYLAILILALTMTAPAVFGPLRTNDSYWIDWVWVDQFARELGDGNLYPRWLPLSHNGLGSPVFYYYPPLAFFVGAAFALAGLSTYAAVIATFVSAFVLSGVGMYRWLKPIARAPLLGALIFIIAPYHVYNFYARGAMAETLATAIIPFVMIGLRTLANGARGGLPMTALAYAALIMCHLPLALLASLFLIAPYSAVQSWREPRRLPEIGSALALGVALSAIYLIPAFMLEPFRDTTKLWQATIYQPSNWTFWHPAAETWQNYRSILIISGALAISLLILSVRYRSCWALSGLACLLLAIGTIPALWTLPLLKSVQFPFRLLPVAEFVLATAIAMVPIRSVDRTIASIVLLSISIPITGSFNPTAVSLAELSKMHPDVPENLPPGDRPYGWPSRWALQLSQAHQSPVYNAGTTIAPAFYFPAWQIRCGGKVVATSPDTTTKLLSYRGSPNCERRIVATREEKIGWLVSLLALAMLVGGSVLGWARSPVRRGTVSLSLGI